MSRSETRTVPHSGPCLRRPSSLPERRLHTGDTHASDTPLVEKTMLPHSCCASRDAHASSWHVPERGMTASWAAARDTSTFAPACMALCSSRSKRLSATWPLWQSHQLVFAALINVLYMQVTQPGAPGADLHARCCLPGVVLQHSTCWSRFQTACQSSGTDACITALEGCWKWPSRSVKSIRRHRYCNSRHPHTPEPIETTMRLHCMNAHALSCAALPKRFCIFTTLSSVSTRAVPRTLLSSYESIKI